MENLDLGPEPQVTQTEEQKIQSRTTNKAYASTNEEFRAACVATKIDPTSRQASKWRSKKGRAWKDGRSTNGI